MRLLHDLALLYLSMAQSAEGTLSNAEREAVTDNLHRHYASLERAEVQNEVLGVLAEHASPDALRKAARQAVGALKADLSAAQKATVLKDLVRIARADGVILDSERTMLGAVAVDWGMALPREAVEAPRPGSHVFGHAWGSVHHLAYIYLVLAHAPDHDFSGGERLLILRKLRAWDPSLDDQQVRTVLEQAIEHYAQGHDAERLAASVDAIKADVPLERRREALRDLTQIANVDGVFLDSEEDLLNALTAAWSEDVTTDE